MTSPILGPFEQNTAKSVLDKDYDLMGLSQNKAFDEDSFYLNHGVLDEFGQDRQPKEFPFGSQLNTDYALPD